MFSDAACASHSVCHCFQLFWKEYLLVAEVARGIVDNVTPAAQYGLKKYQCTLICMQSILSWK